MIDVNTGCFRHLAQPRWVSWVSEHPKNLSCGVRHPKKLKGNIRPTGQKRDVGISHLYAVVKCTKRYVKCTWTAPTSFDPTGAAYDAPPDPLVSWRRVSPIHLQSMPSTAVVGCLYFVGTGIGHPQFLKRGCALSFHVNSYISNPRSTSALGYASGIYRRSGSI